MLIFISLDLDYICYELLLVRLLFQSNEFVISVGYPVILDGTFMGVSAVSIPLIELSQISHPSLVSCP